MNVNKFEPLIESSPEVDNKDKEDVTLLSNSQMIKSIDNTNEDDKFSTINSNKKIEDKKKL